MTSDVRRQIHQTKVSGDTFVQWHGAHANVPMRHRKRSDTVANGIAVQAPLDGSLKGVSVNRLTCLLRHWTWADEARARFERELANGWESDDDPSADRLFGAYYQWCALLCGFTEAALDHELLLGPTLDALRPDLDATLPGLRACRHLLVVIPPSREEHPRLVELLSHDETLGRLRRVHLACGEALREVQIYRQLDVLDL